MFVFALIKQSTGKGSKRLRELYPMSVSGCDFNRWTQHLISDYREEDVVNEVPTEDDLGLLLAGREI
jgi:hypothetical protein